MTKRSLRRSVFDVHGLNPIPRFFSQRTPPSSRHGAAADSSTRLRVAPEKCRLFQGLQVLDVVGGRVHWAGPLFPPRRFWGSSPLVETRNTPRMVEFRSQLRAEYNRYSATLADPSIGSSSVPQRRLLAFPRTTTPTRLQPTEYTAPTPLPSRSR